MILQKKLFLKHQNKAEFKNLDDSRVLSDDFAGLKVSEASMTSTASTTFVASMTYTALSGILKHCNGAEETLDYGIFYKYGHVRQAKGGPGQASVPIPSLKQTNYLYSLSSSKKNTDLDCWIIHGAQMTFLWNGSSKIQFLIDICKLGVLGLILTMA